MNWDRNVALAIYFGLSIGLAMVNSLIFSYRKMIGLSLCCAACLPFYIAGLIHFAGWA